MEHNSIHSKFSLGLCGLSLFTNLFILTYSYFVLYDLFLVYVRSGCLQLGLLIFGYLGVQILNNESVIPTLREEKREVIQHAFQILLVLLVILFSMILDFYVISLATSVFKDYPLIYILYGSIIVPIAEEMAFRGLTVAFLHRFTHDNKLSDKTNDIIRVSVIFLQAILFASLHGQIDTNMIQIIAFAFIGGYYFYKTNDFTSIIII